MSRSLLFLVSGALTAGLGGQSPQAQVHSCPEPPRDNPRLRALLQRVPSDPDPAFRRDLGQELARAVLLRLNAWGHLRPEVRAALPPSQSTFDLVVLVDAEGRRWMPLFTDWLALETWLKTPHSSPGGRLAWASRSLEDTAPRYENPATFDDWKHPRFQSQISSVWNVVHLRQAPRLPVEGFVLNPGREAYWLSYEQMLALPRRAST